MRRPPVAAALLALLGALGLHLGVAGSARRQRDEARQEFARLRTEREALRVQAAQLERRFLAAPAPSGEAAAVRDLRAALLRATQGLPLEGVQIAAEAAGRGAIAANGRLVAHADQATVLRLADRLAETASGVLLDTVILSEAREGDVRLEVEAATQRAEPVPGGRAAGQGGA